MCSYHAKKSQRAQQGERPGKLIKFSCFAVLFVVLLLSGAPAANSQRNDILDSTGLIPRLKKTYKLTSADVASLKPLIRQENVEMLILYLRFSRDPPEYSDRVWNQIIELRREFVSRGAKGLISRRRSALTAARIALERRMLAILVADYVDYLAGYLDLEDWQFDEVNDILDRDRIQKELVVSKHLANLPVLYSELAAVANQTDRNIKRILSPEQLKDFKFISEKGVPLTV